MSGSRFQKPDLLSVLRSPDPDEPVSQSSSDNGQSKNSKNTSPTAKPRTVSDRILKNPLLTLILFCAVALMCAAVSFFVPSASVLIKPETVVSQRNALGDIRSGLDLIRTNISNDVQGIPRQYLLPVTDSPGSPYSKDNSYTFKDEYGIRHYIYEDPTITVDAWRERGWTASTTYWASYARVKISHPTQLRTSYEERTRMTPSKFARKNNAIIAVNGDFFALRKSGVIIRQGNYLRKNKSATEALFIDSDGNFHFMTSTEAIKSGFLDSNNIYNSFEFGPVLVRDGELCKYKSAYTDKIPYRNFVRNPRTGIGQIGPLDYLLIVIDGRSDESAGLGTNLFAQLFYNHGCVNAYNLDGGQSSCMVRLGKVFNEVSNSGERHVSDILYFASAVPQTEE